MNIAVITGESGLAASLYDSTAVKVYKRQKGCWELDREIPLSIDARRGMGEFRKELSTLVERLGPVRTMVGRDIGGIAFNMLDAAGFGIIEAAGAPGDFLDRVAHLLEKEAEEAPPADEDSGTVPRPEKMELEGCYSIDLRQVQASHPLFTSKQILLPFFKNVDFYALEVTCSHVPRWFEVELGRLGLRFDCAAVKPNEYKVTVCRKTCME